ncbi:LysM peptidoglycan-binding domain-containing protein [Intrasporangium sp.]|uniref:LysM peptidoglycan-binding domain-containing protein n=1 Tax=Intrasporangium sp. TaxID=1925024 RepID=UPI00293A2DE8|nr:LysM peptidoglycan-binding domain-containing protein [Intrasporangium sp.]MDV3220044.1 LysM peptidoglycan-binding domain-containing protein [Intrasporangium sp.]
MQSMQRSGEINGRLGPARTVTGVRPSGTTRVMTSGTATTAAGAATCGLAVLASHGWPSATTDGPAAVEDIVSGALAWVSTGLAGWLTLSCAVVLLGAVPGAVGVAAARTAGWLTPHLLRRALSLSLGSLVGIVTVPTAPAIADSAPHGTADGPDRPAQETGSPVPAPGWLPDAPSRVMQSDQTGLLGGTLRPTGTANDTVTVQRGDTLWSIAADHLGPRATDAEIAGEWPRWFEANREVIGGNPDLILPGQQLRVPASEVTR